MAHYILSDDFDFDSIIIKDISFDLKASKLSLTFTYNDSHELTTSVDLLANFATTEYVDTAIINSLKNYSTTTEIGNMIATALGDYDSSTEVTSKINQAIANALTNYYTKTEVDEKNTNLKTELTGKINEKNINGVSLEYSTDKNTITTKVKQIDGTEQSGSVIIPKVTNTTDGLMSSAQSLKLNGIASNANLYVLPQASASALGGIKAVSKDDSYTVECKVGADGKLYVTEGQYDLKIASPTTLGGVKPTAVKSGAYTTPVAVDSEGGLFTIPGNYVLPKASATELGGVKIANGLSIDTDGDLSVSVDGTTIDEGQTGLEVKTDGESIQAGANGLEVKVDNSTIKVGNNGLEVAEAGAKIFPDFDNVIYAAMTSSTFSKTLESDAFIYFGDINTDGLSVNGLAIAHKYNAMTAVLYAKSGTILGAKDRSFLYIFGLKS